MSNSTHDNLSSSTLGVTPPAKKKRFKKIRITLVSIAAVVLFAYVAAITNHFVFTRYSINESETIGGMSYSHADDMRTTGIVNYLTGGGPLPESEKLPLFRQYVKNVSR